MNTHKKGFFTQRKCKMTTSVSSSPSDYSTCTKTFQRSYRIRQRGIVPKLTIDEVLLVLLKRKYPQMVLKHDASLLNFDSSQELLQQPSSSSNKEILNARHIKIINENDKTLVQIQYDFHCFNCKKIWNNLNLLLEHWMYEHVNDFCVLNIDRTLHGNIVVEVNLTKSFSSTRNNQKFYDVLTFKELPSKNILTFAAVNLFYNFSFEDQITQNYKLQMKRWIEKTEENVNKQQIETITEINTTPRKVQTFNDFKHFISTHKQESHVFWMEYLTFLRSIYAHQHLLSLTELENLEILIFEKLRSRQTSAPIQSTRSIGDSELGSLTSRKTSTSKLTNITSSNQSGEKNSHHNGTVDVSLKYSQEALLENKLEFLLNDDDIYSARQSIKDAYLFKSYERDTSKFARKISLSQLGVTLVFETKESFYNFYNRFKTSSTGSMSNIGMEEIEPSEPKHSVLESDLPTTLEC
ncbi:hypothetical protein C9374_008897 [Naegleria lovaniensis]|uniref:C2H2-type domain-containing protein n=1 Tax=Naegleria lovaniensis TaxID=51637 RepID=A0AA88GE64_NAELO|nr:uncharacterized protein C9374_008897 [Naegleria lovaniensis]KAG2377812.1 hypothetical protein C9374_008897 [Naegleria lovaniensis]